MDVFQSLLKKGSEADIRQIQLEFLVDTGAAMICLPTIIIHKLGLVEQGSRKARTANGIVERKIFSPVSVVIQERETTLQVMELDDDTPPLLGYLALESLDLVVNTKLQKLEGNPENDGKLVVDLLRVG